MTVVRSHRARRALAAVLVAAAATGLAGCAKAPELPAPPPGIDFDAFEPGDGNGVWLVRDADLRDAVIEAMRGAGPVVMTGRSTELVQPDPQSEPVPGRTLQVAFAGRQNAFAASVAAGDRTAEFLVDGGTTRVRANAAYADALARPELVDSAQCTVGDDPAVAQWAPALDPAALIESLLAGSNLRADRPTGDGDTIEVTIGSAETVIGTMTVERFGDPVPRRLTIADSSGDAEFTFDAWGEPVDLEARAAELPCP